MCALARVCALPLGERRSEDEKFFSRFHKIEAFSQNEKTKAKVSNTVTDHARRREGKSESTGASIGMSSGRCKTSNLTNRVQKIDDNHALQILQACKHLIYQDAPSGIPPKPVTHAVGRIAH